MGILLKVLVLMKCEIHGVYVKNISICGTVIHSTDFCSDLFFHCFEGKW